MVWTPLPGMLKLIASAPAAEFAATIAARRLPWPLSFALTTVKVAGVAGLQGALSKAGCGKENEKDETWKP